MPVLMTPPATAHPALTPTGNRGPVERAVVAGAFAAADPETLVRTDIPQDVVAVDLLCGEGDDVGVVGWGA